MSRHAERDSAIQAEGKRRVPAVLQSCTYPAPGDGEKARLHRSAPQRLHHTRRQCACEAGRPANRRIPSRNSNDSCCAPAQCQKKSPPNNLDTRRSYLPVNASPYAIRFPFVRRKFPSRAVLAFFVPALAACMFLAFWLRSGPSLRPARQGLPGSGSPPVAAVKPLPPPTPDVTRTPTPDAARHGVLPLVMAWLNDERLLVSLPRLSLQSLPGSPRAILVT